MENLILYQILIVSSICLYLLWSWGIRKNYLDSYRQSLFELRDKLFDYSLTGNITFDHKAYREVRKRLNLMIRFAHRLNTFDLLLSGFLYRKYSSVRNLNKEINDAISQISSPEVKIFIIKTLEEANSLSFTYFIKANIFSFWFAALIVGIDAILKGKTKVLKINRHDEDNQLRKSIKPLWNVSTIENRSIKRRKTRPVLRVAN